jgi:GTP-binding protein EngB required for normal cell division
MAISTTQRRAIDSVGHLGSFYDIYQDTVLDGLTINDDSQEVDFNDPLRCKSIDDNMDKSQNLLKMIGIDDELRLNILLNPALRTRIAALVDHPRLTDKYTRFLYFFYIDREQRLPDDPTEVRKCVQSSLRDAKATHIITSVSWGIDVVVVLQLPPKDNTVNKIDTALKKIRDRFESSNTVSSLTPDYKDPKPSNSYIPLKQSDSDKLEHHLIRISNKFKRLKHSLDGNLTKLLSDYLENQLHDAKTEWRSLQKEYECDIEILKDLVIDIRNDQKHASEIDQILKHQNQTTLEEKIKKLEQRVNDLEIKGQLISSLQQQHFIYCDVTKRQVDRNDKEQSLANKLIKDNKCDRVLCSNDELNRNDNNQSTLNKLRDRLVNECRDNRDLHLIYADFTYCSYKLPQTMILPSSEQNNNKNIDKRKSSSPTVETQTSATPLSPSNDEIINILLLGESGVGKSTFINAFANYLTFDTLNEAEDSKPVVLIPVSFMMTTGSNFEECTVKFGDSVNEDFDHPGESVTQCCRSYLFHLNRNDGRKLRIIDTPGFGDTRGLDQDDLNMQHILEYIHNLTHLHAVCFLFKPNASQINTYFQTCLTQFLDILGSDASQNIIFCFTNARSTFYTPGETAPLLRAILKSLPKANIQFKKENTFCFDSESFRYLAALQNSIKFDNLDKHEYEMSWSTSVSESNRLTNYIGRDITACRMQSQRQSIKDAQLKIGHMIRPMLETMRSFCRNMILWKIDSQNKWIDLIPKAIHRPATICLLCGRDSIKYGNFYILADNPHEIEKRCYVCDCASNEHMSIDYKLDYEYLNRSSNHDKKQMKDILKRLIHASTEFGHFLVNIARSSIDDPFWMGLVRMITEENYLAQSQGSELNSRLSDKLKNLKSQYDQLIGYIKPNQEHGTLQIIYDWIDTVCEYPMVQVQMVAVKQTQQNMMEQSEYKVPNDPVNTSVHSPTSP